MPKSKTVRYSRRKSHKISVPKARDEDDANITFEEFEALEVVPSFTSKMIGYVKGTGSDLWAQKWA